MTMETLVNSPETLAHKIKSNLIPINRVWGMVALRSVLSFCLLLSLAGIFYLSGTPASIQSSAAWWLWFITITNIVSIALMYIFSRKEGVPLMQMYFARNSTWKGDLVFLGIALVGSVLLIQFPGIWLADVLFSDQNIPNKMLLQPLPVLAIYPLILLMPATQAFAELPIYWGYAAPRLKAFGLNRWLVISIVGFVLSIQHMFFSFQLDLRYDLWLAIKYLPFALWTGFLIDKRPTVLPYLMGLHFLLDFSLPILILLVTQGNSLFN